ncbi:MAG TPA: DUF3108 domain-containing protein [Xanthomonadaceae bacterium]|nr:DUF3108 domain-containing protein [Xanthomonadaceae bacterium]
MSQPIAHPARRRSGAGLRLALAAIALFAAAPVLALEPFTAKYEAWYEGSRQGDGVMRLARDGKGRWAYSLDVRGTSGMAAIAGADLSQHTVFDVSGGHWRPLSGSDSSKLLFKSSTRNAIYDWGRGEARWTGDVKPERAGPVKLRAGDMDAMLLNLALARDVAAGNPLDYRLVENGRASQHHYKVAGTEQVTVGGAKREAVKVVRTDDEKQTVAWIVKGIPVPVRILQRDEGEDKLDLRLISID